MNVFQKVNLVRKAIPYIQKDRSVSTGGGSYQAVSHDAVTAMVRPAMIEHGIVCYPVLVESLMNPPADGAKQSRYEATYDFHFVNEEDPADRLTIRIQAHAMDNADKAPGKALSYAKKYAILKLMEIETGESDESRYEPEKPEKLDTDARAVWVTSFEACRTKEQLKAAWVHCMDDCKSREDRDSADILKKAMLIIHSKIDEASEEK